MTLFGGCCKCGLTVTRQGVIKDKKQYKASGFSWNLKELWRGPVAYSTVQREGFVPLSEVRSEISEEFPHQDSSSQCFLLQNLGKVNHLNYFARGTISISLLCLEHAYQNKNIFLCLWTTISPLYWVLYMFLFWTARYG